MLDTRRAEWLSRFQASGPSAVAWVLAALIAAELARIAVALLSGPVKSPEPIVSATVPRPRTGVNVQAVVSAHLFGVAVADPTTQDPNNAPLSSASLVLAGTIATDNPKKGIAIISDGGPSKVFSVGDNVSGASLYSVYLDRVILDRGGKLETLLLPRVFKGGSRPTPPRPVAVAAADVKAVQRLKDVKRMGSVLDEVMRLVPSYDYVAQRLRGFRAYPGRNRAMFSELGLKTGDLVVAVNGQPLDDVRHSEAVVNTIQTSSSVVVTIERDGQRQDVTLNVADVAAAAARGPEAGNPGGAGVTPGGRDAPPGGAGATPDAPAGPLGPAPEPHATDSNE